MIDQRWIVAGLFILLTGLLWGSRPLMGHYVLQFLSSSKFKATILSFETLVKQLFTAGLQLLLGWLIGAYSFSQGYVTYAGFAVIVLLGLYILVYLRSPDTKTAAM